MLVILLRPLLSSRQAFLSSRIVSGYQFHLEVPWNGYQSSLELIVVDIIGVWRLGLTSHDLVRRYDPHQRSEEEALCNVLAGTGSSSGAEGEMPYTESGWPFNKGLVCDYGLQPSLGIELASV